MEYFINTNPLVDGVEFFCTLLIFCLIVLSIVERGLLKSPTITVDLPISHFSAVSFCSPYLAALLFGAYTFGAVSS